MSSEQEASQIKAINLQVGDRFQYPHFDHGERVYTARKIQIGGRKRRYLLVDVECHNDDINFRGIGMKEDELLNLLSRPLTRDERLAPLIDIETILNEATTLEDVKKRIFAITRAYLNKTKR
jgi:hypothetical protein